VHGNNILLIFMKVKASAPIHAATDIETATVTAIKMIAATTGLNAFLLFKNFIILVFKLKPLTPCMSHNRPNMY